MRGLRVATAVVAVVLVLVMTLLDTGASQQPIRPWERRSGAAARPEAGFPAHGNRRQAAGKMNKETASLLEAAGWVFGSAEDFLELTAEERAILEVRVKERAAIRESGRKRPKKITQA